MMGILITFLLEKVAVTHRHSHGFSLMEREEEGGDELEESRGIHKDAMPHGHAHSNLNMVMIGVVLSFHSVIEGIALGIENTTTGTNNILVAILAHKIFDAF